MSMEEKNQFIEQYIRKISLQVNNQYGKQLIDDNKITRAIAMFKNSSDDLETVIIPKINELVQQVIEDYLEEMRKKEKRPEIDYNSSFQFNQTDVHGNMTASNKRVETDGKRAGKGYNAPIIVKYDGKTGYLKNSNNMTESFDKFEYVICALGKKLGIKMAETYKLYQNDNYVGIISEGVDELGDIKYDASDIIKLKDNNPDGFPINTDRLKELMDDYKKLSDSKNINTFKDLNGDDKQFVILDDIENIEKAITLFPKIVSLLEVPDEQKKQINQDYYNMIVLDLITGNVDRIMDNYGIIKRNNGNMELCPLFDNSTISIPFIPSQYTCINGYLINKDVVMDNLYEKHYEQIKPITSKILQNKDEYDKFLTNICDKNLNGKEQNWLLKDNINPQIKKICTKEREKQINNLKEQRFELTQKQMHNTIQKKKKI